MQSEFYSFKRTKFFRVYTKTDIPKVAMNVFINIIPFKHKANISLDVCNEKHYLLLPFENVDCHC